jgi:hypothetical protein
MFQYKVSVLTKGTLRLDFPSLEQQKNEFRFSTKTRFNFVFTTFFAVYLVGFVTCGEIDQ